MPTETCTVIFQGAYDGTRKREGVFKERQFGWYRRSVQLLSHVCGTGVVFFISMLRNKAVGSGPSIAAQNQIKAKKPNGGNNHEKDKHHP